MHVQTILQELHMEIKIQSSYPSINLLREKAKAKIPGFAFDYLDGGCNSNTNIKRNTEEIRKVLLKPYYLRSVPQIDMSVKLFGHTYAAPFGVAPIGLQGSEIKLQPRAYMTIFGQEPWYLMMGIRG